MRALIAVASLLFLAVLLAHVARLVAEGWRVLAQPMFTASTLMGPGMVAWGAALLWRGRG